MNEIQEVKQLIKNNDIQGLKTKIENIDVNQFFPSKKHNWSWLHFACFKNSKPEVINLLIEKGADIKLKTNWTPLHFACKKCDSEIVDLLLKFGADIRAKTKWTPTHFACAFTKDPKVIQILSKNHAKRQSKNGRTPFHVACEFQQSIPVMKEILEYFMVPFINDNTFPLLLACQRNKNLEIIEVLLKSECIKTINWGNKMTPLHFACKQNNLELVRLLIKYQADPESETIWTPLRILIKYSNNLEIYKEIIDSGIQLKSSDDGYPLNFLHKACKFQSIEVIKFLIDSGSDINENFGKTPLHVACYEEKLELVKFLLEYGAKVNGNENFTPLCVACQKKNFEIIKLLVEHGAILKYENIENIQAPLHIACRNQDNIEVIKFLIDSGSDINAQDGKTPLHVACLQEKLELVKFLLEYGAKVNGNDNFTPLCAASQKKNFEIIKLLVEHGAILKYENIENIQTPLHIACRNQDNLKIIKFLVDSGSYINAKDGRTPLHVAFVSGFMETIQYLISSGANIDTLNQENAFHLASSLNPKLEMFQLLLDYKLDINKKSGFTPLHILCKNMKNIDCIKFLLEHGADPNVQCNRTPLHYICGIREPNKELISLLLKHGADPNILTQCNTLHFVCSQKDNPEIVQLLLDHKVDINKQDGITPLYMACSHENFDTLELLLKNGADPNLTDKITPLLVCMKKFTPFKIFKLLFDYGAEKPKKFEEVNIDTPDIKDGDQAVKNIYRSIGEHNLTKLYEFIDQYFSIISDLKEVLECLESFDIHISTIDSSIGFHKCWIFSRLEIYDINQIYEVFKSKTIHEVLVFRNFIYTGEIENEEIVKDFCEKLKKPDLIKKNKKKDIMEAMKRLYLDEKGKDFTIIVDEKPIKAHKFVLTTRSNLFKSMFISVQDSSDSVHDYSNKSYKTIEKLVEFFYTDEIKEMDSQFLTESEDAVIFYQLNDFSWLNFIRDSKKMDEVAVLSRFSYRYPYSYPYSYYGGYRRGRGNRPRYYTSTHKELQEILINSRRTRGRSYRYSPYRGRGYRGRRYRGRGYRY
ncbi:transient receptor potential cation channel subfamily a member 1 [Anaeramoeba ignava]|uniref:Transient receptor potential cation channel subfamily a member 1 n=1 Tax=Anaeramoeba ignava TaxID=1746090 RepID=A0A9Q0R855_ANAIG|nr:transient receptor potential cation channel subfamily a member 1 [Anaeramoeba ignava]